MPDNSGKYQAWRERRDKETEAARFLSRENLARARAVQGLNDYGQNWDITEVETGQSARTYAPWSEIEKRLDVADEDEAARICIWCGAVCESIEALDEHEVGCGRG